MAWGVGREGLQNPNVPRRSGDGHPEAHKARAQNHSLTPSVGLRTAANSHTPSLKASPVQVIQVHVALKPGQRNHHYQIVVVTTGSWTSSKNP